MYFCVLKEQKTCACEEHVSLASSKTVTSISTVAVASTTFTDLVTASIDASDASGQYLLKRIAIL